MRVVTEESERYPGTVPGQRVEILVQSTAVKSNVCHATQKPFLLHWAFEWSLKTFKLLVFTYLWRTDRHVIGLIALWSWKSCWMPQLELVLPFTCDF